MKKKTNCTTCGYKTPYLYSARYHPIGELIITKKERLCGSCARIRRQAADIKKHQNENT